MLANVFNHHLPVVAGVVLQVIEVGIVVVVELQIWTHRNVSDELLQSRLNKLAAQCWNVHGRPCQQFLKGFICNIHTLDKHLAPDQVIQADDLNKDIVRIFLAINCLHGSANDRGSVAQAGVVDIRVPLQCLAYHARWVCQVNEVAALLCVVLDGLCNLQHSRDGLEAHDHTTRSRSFLTNQTMLEGNRFIHVAAIGHTWADGGDNEIRIRDSFVQIHCQGDLGGHAGLSEHLLHILSGAV